VSLTYMATASAPGRQAAKHAQGIEETC
jgi:hypothetical protein